VSRASGAPDHGVTCVVVGVWSTLRIGGDLLGVKLATGD